jgi:hypothetical protein
VEIGISRSGARETLARGCEERPARGGGLCEEGCEEGVAGHWAESRGREQGREREKRKGAGRAPRVFLEGKWFTEKFFVNRFPFFC